MERILRVRNWDKNFETCETRKFKNLKWVPVSNNQSDPGYAKLLQRADGPQLLGAWIAILQAASRCKTRGVFVEGDGTPYDMESLAAVVRMPVELIESAVVVLTTQLKWLEWVNGSGEVQSPATPGESPATTSLNRTEQNRTELNLDHKDLIEPKRNITSANSEGTACDIRKIAAATKPRTPQERELVAKAAMLGQVGPLSQNAVWDSVEAVLRVDGVRKPMAYFRKCLGEHAQREGHNLPDLLAAVRAPPELVAECCRAPDERLCEVIE